MEKESLQTEKSYPVKQFLDSLGKSFKQLELRISAKEINHPVGQDGLKFTYKFNVMNAVDTINLTSEEKDKILLVLTSVN